jgi:hypothetical protein
LVTVCEYCRSVVARGDRRLEDLGKVADLVQTDSVLEVGRKGRYQGKPFELTGRAQLGHTAGGVWDEWYAAFPVGRWGWLAEAQGRFYLTFEEKPTRPNSIPPFDSLALGASVQPVAGAGWLTVAEKGTATYVSAEGEIPYRLVPGATYRYADLSGPAGEFGTLDYGPEPPAVYLGRQVTLDDLGMPAGLKPRQREGRHVEALQLNCPQCGGPLELRAPDRTERVGCPNCGALLDANQGNLSLLKALDGDLVRPLIPLGTVGTLGGQRYTVIGFLRRSVLLEGVRYFWQEYLLYEPRLGFRWLVQSDNHWTFVEPLPPGAVAKHGTNALYEGVEFKRFQRATAQVEQVLGEFYWKVEAGEEVQATDYVRPPRMLSLEVSGGDAGGEINWSLGTYLPRAEVEAAFGVKNLPAPTTVGPNQPFPYKGIYRTWGLLSLAALVLGCIVFATHTPRKVFEQMYQLQPLTGTQQTQVLFSEPFALAGHRNLRITARSDLENSWLYLDGALINEETGEVQLFAVPVEYYHGVEDGEAWSEGAKQAATYVSAQPAGNYTLRLEVEWQNRQAPATVEVRIDQGIPRVMYWFLTLGALAVIPAGVGLYHYQFEKSRWEDSAC